MKTQSTGELLKQYDELRGRIKKYESNKANTIVPTRERSDVEPYKSEETLRYAIENAELRDKKVFEVRYFWLCGLAFLAFGIIIYKKVNPLLGLPLIITGFSEMIGYTNPFNMYDSFTGYEVLLDTKLALSLISTSLLVITAFFIDIMKDEQVTE